MSKFTTLLFVYFAVCFFGALPLTATAEDDLFPVVVVGPVLLEYPVTPQVSDRPNSSVTRDLERPVFRVVKPSRSRFRQIVPHGSSKLIPNQEPKSLRTQQLAVKGSPNSSSFYLREKNQRRCKFPLVYRHTCVKADFAD